MDHNIYSEVTPEIIQLAKMNEKADIIATELFTKYDVKRGLRDLNGKGVLAGLTRISDVRANRIVDGVQIPIHGNLFYRGYNVKDLVDGFTKDNRFGFEEVTYLLLFDKLPNKKELDDFCALLSFYRNLPTSFVRDIIMKAPSRDMMNTLARSVLTLYSYDDRADDTSLPNVLRQCLQLISLFPLLSIYGYQAYSYYHDGKSLYIHSPLPELSAAENILHIVRYFFFIVPVGQYPFHFLEHLHHLDIGTAVPWAFQGADGRRNDGIGVGEGRSHHMSRKTGVITAAMLHMEYKGDIQYPCLQRGVRTVRTQNVQYILGRPERPKAWRSQYQGGADVRGNEKGTLRLER